MLDMVPNAEQMITLVGEPLYEIWTRLCALIDASYSMERLWSSGGKAWVYEYKYRRGGKTLCALYARENCIGFMIILGKDERLKFETDKEQYWDIWGEQILVFFVYTYFCGGVYDDMIYTKAVLSVFSVLWIREIIL